MEIHSSFPQFLRESAILSQQQAQELDSAMSKQDENQKIFGLADFFRCLTASDCYDLSLRLYMHWKRSEQPLSDKQPSIQKISDSTPHKSAQQSFKSPKNDTSMTTIHSSRKTRFMSPDVSDCETRAIVRCNTQTSDIFDSTQKSSQRRESSKADNETKKLEYELAGCTFKPKISRSHMTRSSINVFGRLQTDQRKLKQEMNEAIKSQKEMKGCTFKPEVLNPSHGEESKPSEAILSRTFDRLYKENQRRKNASIDNELKRREREVRGCTFKPDTGSRTDVSPADGAARSEKLHKMHEERERKLLKKKLETSMEEENKYSFKPQLMTSPTHKRDTSKDVYQRLLEWKDEKNRKLEMRFKEKVRQEVGMSQERALTSRKKDDSGVFGEQNSIHDRLYKDGTSQKIRKEKIVQEVLKDMGASFKPKTNANKYFSSKDKKRQASEHIFNNENRLNSSVEDEAMPSPRPRSPIPQQLSSRRDALTEVRNNTSVNSEIPTATFAK